MRIVTDMFLYLLDIEVRQHVERAKAHAGRL